MVGTARRGGRGDLACRWCVDPCLLGSGNADSRRSFFLVVRETLSEDLMERLIIDILSVTEALAGQSKLLPLYPSWLTKLYVLSKAPTMHSLEPRVSRRVSPTPTTGTDARSRTTLTDSARPLSSWGSRASASKRDVTTTTWKVGNELEEEKEKEKEEGEETRVGDGFGSKYEDGTCPCLPGKGPSNEKKSVIHTSISWNVIGIMYMAAMNEAEWSVGHSVGDYRRQHDGEDVANFNAGVPTAPPLERC